MKFRVDVDCTPQELRTFFGMPDVEPMQKAVMDEMQRRMVTSMDQFSPASVMKDWFAPMTAMQQAFTSAMTGAAGAAAASTGYRRPGTDRRLATHDGQHLTQDHSASGGPIALLRRRRTSLRAGCYASR